jgi:hypothetical protein
MTRLIRSRLPEEAICRPVVTARRDRGDRDTTQPRHQVTASSIPTIGSVIPPTGTHLGDGGPELHAVIDSPPARTWIWVALAVAPVCGVVGLAASIGAGSVLLLNAALIAGGVAGGCTFLLLVAWYVVNRRVFSRHRLLEVPRPYSWVAFACAAGSLAVVAASLVTGHDGKAFVCHDTEYCQFTSQGTVRISTTAYLENQGGGALFIAFWTGIVGTFALAASRRLMRFRVVRRE